MRALAITSIIEKPASAAARRRARRGRLGVLLADEKIVRTWITGSSRRLRALLEFRGLVVDLCSRSANITPTGRSSKRPEVVKRPGPSADNAL
jgi:hypothetical protein